MADTLQEYVHKMFGQRDLSVAISQNIAYMKSCSMGELMTQSEFVAEASNYGALSKTDKEKAINLYGILANHFENNRIDTSTIWQHAHYKWMINDPDGARIWCRTIDGDYIVNNCAIEIPKNIAKYKINKMWGFDISKTKVLSRSFYDATDYQCILFYAAGTNWIYAAGDIAQIDAWGE